jgi:hypothetical protein
MKRMIQWLLRLMGPTDAIPFIKYNKYATSWSLHHTCVKTTTIIVACSLRILPMSFKRNYLAENLPSQYLYASYQPRTQVFSALPTHHYNTNHTCHIHISASLLAFCTTSYGILPEISFRQSVQHDKLDYKISSSL